VGQVFYLGDFCGYTTETIAKFQAVQSPKEAVKKLGMEAF